MSSGADEAEREQLRAAAEELDQLRADAVWMSRERSTLLALASELVGVSAVEAAGVIDGEQLAPLVRGIAERLRSVVPRVRMPAVEYERVLRAALEDPPAGGGS